MTENDNAFFLTPIGRRILVQPDDFEHKGLIKIPDSAKRKTTTGRIIVMGPVQEGDSVFGLKPGDRILYDRFSGSEIGFESEVGQPDRYYRSLSFDEVLYRINDESKSKE